MVICYLVVGPRMRQFTTHLPYDRVPLESQLFSLHSTLLQGIPKIIQMSQHGSPGSQNTAQSSKNGAKMGAKTEPISMEI